MRAGRERSDSLGGDRYSWSPTGPLWAFHTERGGVREKTGSTNEYRDTFNSPWRKINVYDLGRNTSMSVIHKFISKIQFAQRDGNRPRDAHTSNTYTRSGPTRQSVDSFFRKKVRSDNHNTCAALANRTMNVSLNEVKLSHSTNIAVSLINQPTIHTSTCFH